MGDSLRVSYSSKSSEPRVITTTKARKGCLVASVPKGFSKKSLQCIASMKQGILGNGAAGDIGVFLLTTAALEIVRRLSKAKCPFVWHGLQALQLLCYPPLRWIQRWAPFKGLVKNMEVGFLLYVILFYGYIFFPYNFRFLSILFNFIICLKFWLHKSLNTD